MTDATEDRKSSRNSNENGTPTMRTRMWLGVLIAIATALLFALGVFFYTEPFKGRQLDTLFLQASHSGTIEGLAAVESLSSEPSELATYYLLLIASSQTAAAQVSEASIVVLGERTSSIDISAGLAELVVPESSLTIRGGAAHALRERDCSVECVTHLVIYLFRLSQGDLNIEHRLARDGVFPPLDRAGTIYVTEYQARVEHDIISVLKRSEESTRDTLVRKYGLGTPDIGTFAVQLITTLKLKIACPLLSQSLGGSNHLELRTNLESALKTLQCNPL